MTFDEWWKGSGQVRGEAIFRNCWDAAIEAAAKHCEAMGDESSRAYAAFDQCAESMRLLLKVPK